MSNSTITYDPIIQGQASKEVTANAYFDAASPATLYARRASTCGGLTWGYYGGNVTVAAGTLAQIANGTIILTAASTNYVVALKSTGAVSASTSTTNWNDTASYWRLYSITTGASTVTSYTDARELGKMTGGLAVLVKDEGGALTSALTSINFVGSGVTATNTGGDVTVTITTGSSVTVKDEGTNLTTDLASIDFIGAGVSATNTGGAVSVTISGATATMAINTQTASYTLVIGDAEKYVRMNVASANNLTVPPNSSVSFATGTQIHVRQVGAGKTTIVAGSGVTINTPETLLLRKQKSSATLIKVATDEWDLMGDLEAA